MVIRIAKKPMMVNSRANLFFTWISKSLNLLITILTSVSTFRSIRLKMAFFCFSSKSKLFISVLISESFIIFPLELNICLFLFRPFSKNKRKKQKKSWWAPPKEGYPILFDFFLTFLYVRDIQKHTNDWL